jgi:hypothetical protein
MKKPSIAGWLKAAAARLTARRAARPLKAAGARLTARRVPDG